jgi:hypothetical protein
MRIWSLHPKYLDTKGLVALWRETLLAKHVLAGMTKGYTNHPQLTRFRNIDHPLGAIENYLESVYEEAQVRGYNFDKSKFSNGHLRVSINVTSGQFDYERAHLLKKLQSRDPAKYRRLNVIKDPDPHPLFKIVPGGIELWEIR